RSNVASLVFGMSADRFDNLLHLLRQLRKPKLADKLDNAKLSKVLTDALPPLDDSKIEPLAQGFGLLDADVEELRRKEAAHRATGMFVETYRLYARTHARQRAGDVVAAISNFDGVTRNERIQTIALETAKATSERLGGESVELSRLLARATGALAGLDLSAVESLTHLDQLAKADAGIVAGVEHEQGVATGNAADAHDDADAKAATADTDAQRVASALDAARRRADGATVGQGWEHADAHIVSATQLARAVETRQALVEAVDAANNRAAGARVKIGVANANVTTATEARDRIDDGLATATTAAGMSRTMFNDAASAWVDEAPTDRPDADGDTIADELAEHLADKHIDRTARAIAARLAAQATVAAATAVENATIARANADDPERQARKLLYAHDALPADPPPPSRTGIPNERAGTPFWFAIEFRDGVDPGDAAMLEAALDAAGFLDAVVTDSGLRDIGTDETVISADGQPAHGLHDWLRPAAGADTELINRIISSIGAGPDSGKTGWIDTYGTWANGALSGRWTKAAVEHIGANARAAAHARRRAELVGEVDDATNFAADAKAVLEASVRRQQHVASWVGAFPTVSEWATDEREVRRLTIDLARSEAALRTALDAQAEVRLEAAAALAAVDIAVRAAGCTVEQVPVTREALKFAGHAASTLQIAATVAATSSGHAGTARLHAAKLDAQVAAIVVRLESARLTADESRSKFETARRVEGAEVERILAEKEALETDARRFRQELKRVDQEKSEAHDSELTADLTLKETGRLREQAILHRDITLNALAGVVRAGHVALSIPFDTSRDAADYLQPTAGRNLARQLASAIPEADGSDAARTSAINRLTNAYRQLGQDVGSDFNPQLDQSEGLFIATAVMNGEVIGMAELHRALADDVEQRRQAIAAGERALIEQHLRDEVGNHLGQCLHAATTQVTNMNRILKQHPTNSGATVQLKWEVDETAGPAVRSAVLALLTSSATRDETASGILATFLAERVEIARRGDIQGADLTERLTNALDYRYWYSFKLKYNQSGVDSELTAKTVGAGSGGQQAKVGHLPLLAAAAGFYSSSSTAPRLCFLDEAFAGIDSPNTADLLEVTVTLDLDMVMTNFDAWFCVPEVPGLAIYHLEKIPGTYGVAAIRYEWDGELQQELDHWHDG
ncbi:MAG: TIGR02680 family protein, partial [Ilumatobacteraceae bacterium]